MTYKFAKSVLTIYPEGIVLIVHRRNLTTISLNTQHTIGYFTMAKTLQEAIAHFKRDYYILDSKTLLDDNQKER